jgi:hypothetical protein
MKKQSRKQLEQAAQAMEAASATGPKAWDSFLDKYDKASNARVEFPLGELMNANIAGYVWAWNMQGRIVTGLISKADQFNANGPEGKASVTTSYIIALLVWRDLPTYRCNVYA